MLFPTKGYYFMSVEKFIVEFRSVPQEKKQLSWDEIKVLHPNEWVLLVDLAYTQPTDPSVTKDVCGGVVFDHSANKKELVARCKEPLFGVCAALFFTGTKKAWSKLG
jgi:hypothetical protein